MLKFVKQGRECKIEIYDNVSSEEVLQLKELLDEDFYLFSINFTRIYNIPASLSELLYEYTEVLQKNINIVVNKSRLSKYLNYIGLNGIFVSKIKDRQSTNPNIDVIAIGGSANSSAKIIEILSNIDTTKFAIFLIQHIDPLKDGIFDEILESYVESNIFYASQGMDVKVGQIYLASKDRHMTVKDSKIHLEDSALKNGARPSISVSFESLSQEYKENFCGIITCGYATDGVDSLATLKRNNSVILVQNPDDCEASSIPKQAKNQKIYNFVFDTRDMAFYLRCMSLQYDTLDEWITFLFDEIYIRYEYDFRLYQRDSVKRRVEQFMIKHRIVDVKTFVVLVIFDKSAFKSLFLDLSINVTEFFRDVESSKKMIEIIKKEHKNRYNIKIWSAGCSSGEEVYSTAIILNELGLLHKSILYSTDFNPIVIEEAKNSIYSIERFNKAKKAYGQLGFKMPLENYFEINTKFVKVKEYVKQNVLFFVHNLEKDSVFNEFDMIECKNVMIYFNEELKQNIFKMFYDSLKFGGHLLLGPSEKLPVNFEDRFEACDDINKIYRKVA
ncbi:CheR family methyltransferase [Sulfurimonas sp.]|uniref:CheR family methyltransferase n=1 Tax=Sulfurimonas sp. TaxID=2022749 RepID=UPI0035699C57